MNDSKSTRNILLFGPQGSGKGTQGEKLSAWLQLPFIVTGNIFRENIKSGNEIGILIQSYINQGQLVPDEVTNSMIGKRVSQADCQAGFVLDGYPRNVVQANSLAHYTSVTDLIYISVSDAAAIERIAGRRTCVAQGHVYHLTYNPPSQMDICDQDGSALKQRDDDTEAALAQRLEIYHRETEPLLEHYSRLGVVHTINGEQPITQVWSDIQAVFS